MRSLEGLSLESFLMEIQLAKAFGHPRKILNEKFATLPLTFSETRHALESSIVQPLYSQ